MRASAVEAPQVAESDAEHVAALLPRQDEIGKNKAFDNPKYPNLFGPHRLLSGFGGRKIVFIASGCASAHVVALAEDGAAFTWGRNDLGQLGLGDNCTRPGPVHVAALKNKKIVAAASGKSHTLFLEESGNVFASGSSKQGCVGTNFKKTNPFEATPVAVTGLPSIAQLACGAAFNLLLDREGAVWSFGWSEKGVLGNGTDGEHNTAASSIKISYIAQAKPMELMRFRGMKMVQVACGAVHALALSDDGTVFSWGSGDYGRLGHKDQKDIHVPTALPGMVAREVACGAVSSAAVGYQVTRLGVPCLGQTILFMWGRVKSATQNAWMYPKQEDELRGWNVHTISLGSNHTVCHADKSVISWGTGTTNGELGFGVGGKKSSANPAKVETLEGLKVAQLACGNALSVVLAEAEAAIVDKLPEWTPAADAIPCKEKPGNVKEKASAGQKRKGAAAEAKGAKGKKKQ